MPFAAGRQRSLMREPKSRIPRPPNLRRINQGRQSRLSNASLMRLGWIEISVRRGRFGDASEIRLRGGLTRWIVGVFSFFRRLRGATRVNDSRQRIA
jgi:hypothetical protein